MNMRQRLQKTLEWTRQAWRRSLSWTTSKFRRLNPWSLNPGVAAHLAVVATTVIFWRISSMRWCPLSRWFPAQVIIGVSISSGTVVAMSVGLTAIPLALAILLGQIYSGHAGRLRVFLYVCRVQLSLVATVTTAIFAGAVGGRFYNWLTLAGLGVMASLSCFTILKALDLLQQPDQYADTWAQFIVSRQSAITVNSPHRQQDAYTVKTEFAKWGNDIKIDPWFARFSRETLSDYVGIPAQTKGVIDSVDVPALHRCLTVLQEHAESLLTDATITGQPAAVTVSNVKVRGPLLVICCLPNSLVKDPKEALALFRKDILSDTQQKSLAHSLARAFRIDDSESLLRIVSDLRSEASELGHQLMQGVHLNDPSPIVEFQRVSEKIVDSVAEIYNLEASETAQQTYFGLLEALARATDDARCLVENPAAQADREIKDLVLNLPRNLAYAAAETGSPDVFERCLSPLWLQCRDVLGQRPNAPDTRHCLSWYGVLSSAIQRLMEPNAARKTDIDRAVSEARLLLQDLSTLLLLFARQQKWNAADLVAEEISNLEPQRSLRHNDGMTSNEYSKRFGALMYLLYFGAHACLVDRAMAEPPISVPPGLIEATWPNDDFDLPGLLNVYAQATSEGAADAWSWGWEPPQPPLKAYFIRTDEVLAYGFVAIAITWPEPALFQDSENWLVAQAKKLEQAAGGSSDLERLLGAGSLVDKMLKDDDKVTRLAELVSGSRESAGTLMRLLKYLQDTMEANERIRIRTAVVRQDVITGFTTDLANQYDTCDEEAVLILQNLDLLRTGPMPASKDGGPKLLGVSRVLEKRSFIADGSDSWTSIAEEYGNGLRKMQAGAIITWLSEISTAVDLTSILAPDSTLQASAGVLLVDTDVEWLPSDLQPLVESSESPKLGHGAPDAFLRVAGQRLPMYRVWIGGEGTPCLLFINNSNSARGIRVPWNPETGWTLSESNEVKVCLSIVSRGSEAMNALLEQDPAWLKEKAHTQEEKKAYLEELVWLQAYQQLAFDPGATPSILRLDLRRDEPEVPPQTKGTSDGNASE